MVESKSIWQSVWPLIMAQRREAGLGLVLSLLAVAAALYLPWPMKVIVDSILTGKAPLPAWLPAEKAPALAAVCSILLAMHFLRGWLSTWSTTLLVRAGLRMTYDLRCRVYEHLQKLSLVFHEKRPVGDSIYRVTWDTYSIQTLFNNGFIQLVGSGVTLAGIMVIMLRFDVTLTLLALAVAPALGWAIKFYNKRISAVSIDYHDRESKVSSLIQESLSAIRTIQAFAREEDEIQKFGTGAAQSVDANVCMTREQVMSSFVVGLITATGTVAMLWIGGHRVLDGKLSVGELLVFIAYVGMLYGPMSSLSGIAAAVQSAVTPFRRVQELLETAPAIRDLPTARTLNNCHGVVRFDHVTFGYDPSQPVLKDMDFEVQPGQMVALVGASGVGKSTLLSLLLRFYDPQQGRVMVDGLNVCEFQSAELLKEVSQQLNLPETFAARYGENKPLGDKRVEDLLRPAGWSARPTPTVGWCRWTFRASGPTRILRSGIRSARTSPRCR